MRTSNLRILLFFLLINSAFLACKQNAQTPKEIAPKPEHKMKVVKSSRDNVNIHYTISGTGNHALVFVHGWSCDQTYWEKQVAYFKDKYKVVTVDLGGHGKSMGNRENWNIASFGTDVIDVLNVLDYSSVSLIGHSMGVMVVIDAATKYNKPIENMVCVDYLKRKLVAVPDEMLEKMMAPVKADFVGATNTLVKRMFLPTSEAVLIEQITKDMSSAPPKVAIPAMEDLVKRDYSNDLKKLSTKKLRKYIINSDVRKTDTLYYDSLGFKTYTLKNTAHFLMIEAPERFNSLLSEVLENKN